MVEVKLLGEIEVWDRGESLSLAGRQAVLLGLIAVQPGLAPVSLDRIMDALDAQRLSTVQGWIFRLRKSVGETIVTTSRSGYALGLPPEAVDALRFERLVREAGVNRADSEVVALLDEALALWRGPALSGLDDYLFAHLEATRLHHLRIVAEEDRIDAELRLGRHRSLPPRVEALISENPLRERLWIQLTIALYRSGQQADALNAIELARTTLRDEVGLEPGPDLRHVEQLVLNQSTALDRQPSSDDVRTHREVPPEFQWVRWRDRNVIWQVRGKGPSVTFVPGSSAGSIWWAVPGSEVGLHDLDELTGQCRLITYDPLGLGRADPISEDAPPSTEERADELATVLGSADPGGSVLLATQDGGPWAIAFAVKYPRLAKALVLVNTFARLMEAPDYPFGINEETSDLLSSHYEKLYGTGITLDLYAPSRAKDPAIRRAWARWEALNASRSQGTAATRASVGGDVRDLLDQVRCPTTVLHTVGNTALPPEHGRYLAEHIPGARYVELPGVDQFFTAGEVTLIWEAVAAANGRPPG